MTVRIILFFLLPLLIRSASADEAFVTIHAAKGNRLQISQSSGAEPGMQRGGRGARFGGTGDAPGRGRGRFAGRNPVQPTIVTVPVQAKITTAMRERRTFRFRVMGELAGGLRNKVFTAMKSPLQARIFTRNNIVVELNVITGDTDINQTATAEGGQSIIAVKPRRPPMKRK